MNTQKKAEATISEIIECAVSWRSSDADNPDTPPADWQAVIPVMKFAPGLLLNVEDGIEAAQRVVNNWERGDLAGAVHALDGWLDDVRATLAKIKSEAGTSAATA